MADKIGGWCGKAIAIVISGLLVPVLMHVAEHVAVQKIEAVGTRPTQIAQRSAESPRGASPTSPSLRQCDSFGNRQSMKASLNEAPQIDRIIVQGSGWSSAEAVQEALRAALQHELTATVTADTWAKSGRIILEETLRNGALFQWRALATKTEWKLRGTWYREELMVDVNRLALAEHLRAMAAQNPGKAADAGPPG